MANLKETQQIYTKVNFEYPVNPTAKLSNEVASWGKFKMDSLSMNEHDNSPIRKNYYETGW